MPYALLIYDYEGRDIAKKLIGTRLFLLNDLDEVIEVQKEIMVKTALTPNCSAPQSFFLHEENFQLIDRRKSK